MDRKKELLAREEYAASYGTKKIINTFSDECSSENCRIFMDKVMEIFDEAVKKVCIGTEEELFILSSMITRGLERLYCEVLDVIEEQDGLTDEVRRMVASMYSSGDQILAEVMDQFEPEEVIEVVLAKCTNPGMSVEQCNLMFSLAMIGVENLVDSELQKLDFDAQFQDPGKDET